MPNTRNIVDSGYFAGIRVKSATRKLAHEGNVWDVFHESRVWPS